MIDPVLQKLDREGVIRYLRMEGVPHAGMPAMYQSADLVVEQFGIADYSAAACEAMAAGRVVVSRVSDLARDIVLKKTGLKLPVVEANPDTLAGVIIDLLKDPARVAQIGRRGQLFVREVHDGRLSARVLHEWMT
jgi:glycosyltransferase involved in cell wall biosynthesis